MPLSFTVKFDPCFNFLNKYFPDTPEKLCIIRLIYIVSNLSSLNVLCVKQYSTLVGYIDPQHVTGWLNEIFREEINYFNPLAVYSCSGSQSVVVAAAQVNKTGFKKYCKKKSKEYFKNNILQIYIPLKAIFISTVLDASISPSSIGLSHIYINCFLKITVTTILFIGRNYSTLWLNGHL